MTNPWIPVAPLDTEAFASVRRRAIFDCHKWDPQIGDVCSIAAHPLIITRNAWRDVCALAEQLAAETLASPVIDVAPITRALGSGVERLAALTLSREAPPAFLLDSRRDGVGVQVEPGSYDNRWVVLPQDFPSGALLQSRGITNAVLLRRNGLSVPADLAHVLRRWQDVGIRINVTDITTGRTATDVTVPKPSRFKLAWYAAVALLGLHRSNVGGFGSVIPHEAGRRGFYG